MVKRSELPFHKVADCKAQIIMGASQSGNSLGFVRPLHVVILGLDSAGKTTVLYRLKLGEFVNTVPTIGFNMERLRSGVHGSAFRFWDVGGQERLRPLWRSYARGADAIVYVVDSADSERLEEARTELQRAVRAPESQGVPLLVVANKQDLPAALAPGDVEQALGLTDLGPGTLWYLQPACAIIGEGLPEGLEKLREMVLHRRRILKKQKKKIH
uniref:ADP-ribosylation factor-like protein 11 n=1 Tax=Eptatretus burgeri TaxID=7764 RepID=A0A8C4PZM5_EPTBU